MKNERVRTVSTRISLNDFAKARDGLINRGVPKHKLFTNSAILKTAILMCCVLDNDPKSPATKESTETIEQLWQLTKRAKSISLEDLSNL